MKGRIITLLSALLVAMFSLTSCEKEPQELLVGNWELTKVEMTAEGITLEIDPVEAGLAMTLSFAADGTFVAIESVVSEGMKLEGTYVFNENSMTIMLTAPDTYEVMPMKVSSLTKDQLVILEEVDGSRVEMVFKRA